MVVATIGQRNNNPGNLRYNGKDKWVGLASPANAQGFFSFTDPLWGIRAIAVILMTYQDKYGLRTISDLMARYAPEHENPLRIYTDYVTKSLMHLGIYSPASSEVDMHSYAHARPMIEAIIRFENGWTGKNAQLMPYTPGQIDEGLRRAGIVAESSAPSKTIMSTVKDVAKTPQGKAAGILASLELLKQGTAQISDIWDNFGRWGINPHWIMTMAGLVAVAALLWMLAKAYRDRKEGRV